MDSFSLDFCSFIEKSPCVYHAVEEISNRLTAQGFLRLNESENWQLEFGKKYFLIKDDSCVAAFKIPEKTPLSTLLLATHIDSPCLKLKPHAESIVQDIGLINTELYGAPLLHSWFDRDLKIAGKVHFLNKKNQIEAKTIQLPFLLSIPNLAIHLDKSIGEKGFHIHKQDHLKPIFSLKASSLDLHKQIQKAINAENILSSDLFLIPSEKVSFTGMNQEMCVGYRIDNLTSVFAALQALIDTKNSEKQLQLALFWDHEEIGSVSSRGADSIFTSQLLERIFLSLKTPREQYFQALAKSLCLSIDVAHGYHPNYSEKYDPNNSAFLGKGVTIKFNANQKYATSSQNAAILNKLAKEHKIPLQETAGRSDVPTGSTVGSLLAAMTGISTIDLGVATWGMHSARETFAMEDLKHLHQLLKAAINAAIGQ